MKLFVDDARQINDKHAGTDWVLCKSYNEFKKIINQLLKQHTEWIEELSLDHRFYNEHYDGIDCLKYIMDICIKYGLDVPKIYIHSDLDTCFKNFELVAQAYYNRTDKHIELIKI